MIEPIHIMEQNPDWAAQPRGNLPVCPHLTQPQGTAAGPGPIALTPGSSPNPGYESVLTIAIGLNCLMALVGFGLAGWLWQTRRRLAALADALGEWERQSHRALNPSQAPALLAQGQQRVAASRDRYRHVQRLWQQGQQLLALVNALLVAHRWLVRRRPLGRRGRRGF